MTEAGYKLMAAGVHDLGMITHTSRKRWLSVWMNSALIQKWDLIGRYLSPIMREEQGFQASDHCLHWFPEDYLEDLKIQACDFPMLDDPQYLPTWKQSQCAQPNTNTGALACRIAREGQPLPVITAAYRKATGFNMDLLRRKGLMSWFVRDTTDLLRWYDKLEAAHAMGFRATCVIPATQCLGFHAVGNSISPFHAALTMSHAQDIIKAQTGLGESSDFRRVVRSLRSLRGMIGDFAVVEYGRDFHTLAPRTPNPANWIECPLCKQRTNMPLICACQECQIQACAACFTEVCLPSHAEHQATQLETEDERKKSMDETFTIWEKETGDTIQLSVCAFPTLSDYVRKEELPLTTMFFHDYQLIKESTAVKHGDVFRSVQCHVEGRSCPKCGNDECGTMIRLCAKCCEVGCHLCVSDACPRCTSGTAVCRSCRRALAEALALTYSRDASGSFNPTEDLLLFNQILQCPIEADNQHITVLRFPFGKTTVHRGMFGRRAHIAGCLERAGYPVGEDCAFLWGTSKTPDLRLASESYIIAIPSGCMPRGFVPIVYKDDNGESIRACKPQQSGEQWRESVLDRNELQRDDIILCGSCEIWGDSLFQILPGTVLQRVTLWVQQDGLPQAAFPVTPSNIARASRKRDLLGLQKDRVFPNISGYFGLEGGFHPLLASGAVACISGPFPRARHMGQCRW